MTGSRIASFTHLILAATALAGTPALAAEVTFEHAGRQYVAIVSGPSNAARTKLINTPELKDQRHAMVLYVFGL